MHSKLFGSWAAPKLNVTSVVTFGYSKAVWRPKDKSFGVPKGACRIEETQSRAKRALEL